MSDDVRDLYQETILRHARTPLHRVAVDPFDAEAAGDNPLCGDRCQVRIRFGAAGELAEIGWQGRGCAISMASADLMAEAATGQTPDQARALAADFATLVRGGTPARALENLQALAGVSEYPSRIKCALLPWAALTAALSGEKEATSESR